MSHQQHLSALSQLPAAEKNLVQAIDATTSTLNTVGTTALDAALARLEEAVRGVHCRLGAAMGQFGAKVAGVVETLDALALGVMETLSVTRTQPTVTPLIDADGVKRMGPEDHSDVIDLAPLATVTNIVTVEQAAPKYPQAAPNDDSAIDLAPIPATCTLESKAQQPQEAPIAIEVAREPSEDQIAPQQQPQHAGEVVAVAANGPVSGKAPPLTTPKPRGGRRRKS